MKDLELMAREIVMRFTGDEKLIVDYLLEVRNETRREDAEIAKNAFMNEVLPKHTAVRDFIAKAILAKMEELK